MGVQIPIHIICKSVPYNLEGHAFDHAGIGNSEYFRSMITNLFCFELDVLDSSRRGLVVSVLAY